jgi:glycosyltransferase involved in cell wall biosynthesis
MASRREMRPAILHVECATTYGGSVRCLENFLAARRDREYRHLVALYTPLADRARLASRCDGVVVAPDAGTPRGPRLVRRIRALGEYVALARWLTRVIRREHVALIRLNNHPGAHPGAVLAARLTGVPYLAWLRSFPRPSERRWSLLTARTPLLVAVSHAVRDAHVAAGLAADRVITIYDGTSIPAAPAPARPREGTLSFGTLGRLVAWKGLLDVVRAAAHVVRQHAGVRFRLVGDEDPMEPGLKDELLREIDRLDLRGAVSIGRFTADPEAFLGSLDCLLNPSFPAEPFGMSVVEAMALGRPVIASNVGGPAEIIEHERSGLLVPPRDPAALAAAIGRLIAEPGLRAALGAAARRRIEDRFELGRQTMRQQALFRAFLEDLRSPEARVTRSAEFDEARMEIAPG